MKKVKPESLAKLTADDIHLVWTENNALNPMKKNEREVEWVRKANRLPPFYKKVRSVRAKFIVSLRKRGLTWGEISSMLAIDRKGAIMAAHTYGDLND